MAATGQGRTEDEQDGVHQGKVQLGGEAAHQVKGGKHRA